MNQPTADDAAVHPNAAIARRAWQAVSAGDLEELATLIHADVVWHATTRHPWYGEHLGLDGAMDYLGKIGESVDRFDATVVDVLASQERAVMLFHVSARRGERTLETDYVMLMSVRGGRIAEIWTSALAPTAVEVFWADLQPH